jgi:ParB family chromosome partitioning protein
MSKFNIKAINEIQEVTTQSDTTITVDIDTLRPNPYQPRFHEEVDELAQNIKQNGLLQPITINQDNIIVAGHRRYYAHKKLGHKTIKANAIIVDDRQLHIYAIVENLQREQLHPIELAFSYDQAIKNGIVANQKELAQAISKHPCHITKVLSVLKLPDDIIEDIRSKKNNISVETIAILSQFDHDTLRPLYYRYIKGEINRKDISKTLKLYKHNALDDEDSESLNKPYKLTKRKKTLEVSFSTATLTDTKITDLQNEIDQLLKKYL